MRLQRFKIDEKRISFPFVAVAKCPECGAEVHFDGQMNYPVVGAPQKLYALCPNEDGGCDKATSGLVVEVLIEVQVEPAPSQPGQPSVIRIEHARQ